MGELIVFAGGFLMGALFGILVIGSEPRLTEEARIYDAGRDQQKAF